MVYTKMAMKEIEATKEFVEMIERSAKEWKVLKTQLEKKYHLFDTYALDYFGLEIDFAMHGNLVIINGAKVIDPDKYVDFLLRYGDMPNE